MYICATMVLIGKHKKSHNRILLSKLNFFANNRKLVCAIEGNYLILTTAMIDDDNFYTCSTKKNGWHEIPLPVAEFVPTGKYELEDSDIEEDRISIYFGE